MNENDRSTARGFDPDTAPDLSKDGWPDKFAKAPVRRGRPPKARPKVSERTTIRLSQEVIDRWRFRGRRAGLADTDRPRFCATGSAEHDAA